MAFTGRAIYKDYSGRLGLRCGSRGGLGDAGAADLGRTRLCFLVSAFRVCRVGDLTDLILPDESSSHGYSSSTISNKYALICDTAHNVATPPLGAMLRSFLPRL